MIPIWVIVAVASFSAGAMLGAELTQWRADARLAEMREQHAQKAAMQAQDVQDRETQTRVRERRTAFNIMEKADAANLRARDDRAAADRSRVAVNELRHAYTTVAAALGGAAEGAAAPASGTPAAGAGLVLADVFGWCGARVQSCAAALDEARTAGQLCEQAYDVIARAEPSKP